jgi:hypothetical protein
MRRKGEGGCGRRVRASETRIARTRSMYGQLDHPQESGEGAKEAFKKRKPRKGRAVRVRMKVRTYQDILWQRI